MCSERLAKVAPDATGFIPRPMSLYLDISFQRLDWSERGEIRWDRLDRGRNWVRS